MLKLKMRTARRRPAAARYRPSAPAVRRLGARAAELDRYLTH